MDNNEHTNSSSGSSGNDGVKNTVAQASKQSVSGSTESKDWSEVASSKESEMSEQDFAEASQPMFQMMKQDDPDAFHLESDLASVDTDGGGSLRRENDGSDQEQARKKKKHRSQNKGKN